MDSEGHRFTSSFREKKKIKDILYWALVAKWSMLVTQSAGLTVLHSPLHARDVPHMQPGATDPELARLFFSQLRKISQCSLCH